MSFKSLSSKKERVQKSFNAHSLTKQSFKDSCDIKKVINKFQKTGVMSCRVREDARYEDLTKVTDYKDALDQVMRAEASFSDLPSTVRDFYKNDLTKFLAAFESESGLAELEQLGVVTTRKPTPTLSKANDEPLKADESSV